MAKRLSGARLQALGASLCAVAVLIVGGQTIAATTNLGADRDTGSIAVERQVALRYPAAMEALFADARVQDELSGPREDPVFLAESWSAAPPNLANDRGNLVGIPEFVAALQESSFRSSNQPIAFTQLAVVTNAETARALQRVGIAAPAPETVAGTIPRTEQDWAFDVAAFVRFATGTGGSAESDAGDEGNAQSNAGASWADTGYAPFAGFQGDDNTLKITAANRRDGSTIQAGALMARVIDDLGGVSENPGIDNGIDPDSTATVAETDDLARTIDTFLDMNEDRSQSTTQVLTDFAAIEPSQPALALVYESDYLAARIQPTAIALTGDEVLMRLTPTVRLSPTFFKGNGTYTSFFELGEPAVGELATLMALYGFRVNEAGTFESTMTAYRVTPLSLQSPVAAPLLPDFLTSLATSLARAGEGS